MFRTPFCVDSQALFGHDQLAGVDARVQVVLCDGPAEQITLQAVAADLVQEVGLEARLHALGQGQHVDAVGHLDDAVDERPGLLAVLQVGEEAHVELDDVELVILQDVQRRIPAAEVVQPQGVAEVLDAVHRVVQQREVVRQRALGHLDVDQVLGNVVFRRQGIQLRDRVHELEVQAGEVQRDRHDRLAGVHGLPQVPARGLEDGLVELVDQAVFLQHRDELDGGEPAVDRVDPAGQHLAAAELLGIRPHDRLIEGHDPAVFHGVVDVVDDVQPLVVGLAHRLVVLDVDGLETVLDELGGIARAVDRHARVLVVAAQVVSAAVDAQQNLLVVIADHVV